MASREEAPKVSAGSMADIAFLLLIFFLVTTSIETDSGLNRMLPRIDKEPPTLPIHERNILPISINASGELLVENEITDLRELKDITIAFLDNGGAAQSDDRYCDYCLGERDEKSSDSPTEAVVSLMSNRETSYGVYIAVQNELVAAYNTLRNREAQRLYGNDFIAMESAYLNSETSKAFKDGLKIKIKRVQDLYPMKLSEAERN